MTDVIVHEIHDLSDAKVIDLLANGLSSLDKNTDIAKNYHPDFKEESANIFNVLSKGRYSVGKGKYFVIEANHELAVCAGWNEYELDASVALGLTRTYVAPKYRTKYFMSKYILPRIIVETERYEHLYITSNLYNRSIYDFFGKVHDDKTTEWMSIYGKFKPIGIKNIYYVDQYVMEYQRHGSD